MKKIVVITGPTGIGKTSISIELAKIFNAEIINADASQIYKDLNVGTAKIKDDEMKGIKHHLLSFLNINETFSIKDYQELGRKIIDNTNSNIFVVGGSGLYINALLYNYDLNSEPRKSNNYQNLSNEELYQMLYEKNPQKALSTHPNNRRRVERYLELSENNKEKNDIDLPLYDIYNICLIEDRGKLYEKINNRTEAMIDDWIEECKELRKKGYSLENIKEIGYSDINNFLNDEISLSETKEIIKQKTRRYAKRQITWFKHKIDCKYVDIDNINVDNLIKNIKEFYNKDIKI